MAKHQSDKFVASDYWHPRFWAMWGIIGLLRCIALLPFGAQLQLGKLIGKCLPYTSGRRQRIIDINLLRCFPELSKRERNAIKNRSNKNIGISLLEMSMCWWWSEDRLRPLVEIRGKEHIDKALESGRGMILLTGHFTSLEIGARLLALFMPVQVMYRTQKDPLFDRFLYSKRSSYFVNAISRKNTRRLIKGIKKQIPTWYAPDQSFHDEKNVFAPFLGVETATITASSRLAQASNALMLRFYPERKRDGSGYILWIEPPLADFPSDDDIADATKINASIEKFVRQHPGHYMWIHQRFKTRPAGEAGFY